MLAITETPAPLAEKFRALGIDAVTYSHPPVFKVGEEADIMAGIPGGHTKNLFLKDKKGQIWLVTALEDTSINLKWLSDHLSSPRFSFGSAELLMEVLGVAPGSVTPFALINDTQKRARPVLDARMLACDSLNFHPCRNDMTTNIPPAGLMAFMRDLGLDPVVVDFVKE